MPGKNNKTPEELKEQETRILKACIDDIWEEYDDDNSGQLDYEELKKFVKSCVVGMGNT